MVLQATVNDVETFGYMLESIENVTNMIAVSYMIERHFLQPEHSQYAFLPHALEIETISFCLVSICIR